MNLPVTQARIRFGAALASVATLAGVFLGGGTVHADAVQILKVGE